MNKTYDVLVVGGGPAGMLAAGRAAELGARVCLIEKNAKLGKKLLITGGGRCNITNAEFDVRKMVARYGSAGKALFGAFSRFGVEDTISFFESHGLPIKVEAEQRAFPKSNRAEDVWKVLLAYMRTGHVDVVPNAAFAGFKVSGGKIVGVATSTGTIVAKSYIVATGGKSRPETGSTGEGMSFLGKVGHTVKEDGSALVPVKIQEAWLKELSGLSFANAKITVLQDGKKQGSRTGKLLFTHFGLSGPLVLNMSRGMADLYKYGSVTLQLDLFPSLDVQALDKKVLDTLAKFLNKKVKNSLGEIVPPKMIPAVLHLAGIGREKEVNALTKPERTKIVQQLKNFTLTVSGFLGTEKAIVTSGGVGSERLTSRQCSQSCTQTCTSRAIS